VLGESLVACEVAGRFTELDSSGARGEDCDIEAPEDAGGARPVDVASDGADTTLDGAEDEVDSDTGTELARGGAGIIVAPDDAACEMVTVEESTVCGGETGALCCEGTDCAAEEPGTGETIALPVVTGDDGTGRTTGVVAGGDTVEISTGELDVGMSVPERTPEDANEAGGWTE
jgi:hypothetical protein